MSKEQYIRETDSIVPSPELKEKLSKLPEAKKKNRKKKSTRYAIIALAACLVFIIIAGPASNTMLSTITNKTNSLIDGPSYSSSSSDNYAKDESESTPASPAESGISSINIDDRKIIKEARMSVEVKVLDDFIKTVKDEVRKCEGYVSSEDKYIDESSSCDLVVNVPADKLDAIIDVIEANCKVTSQHIDTDDVSSEYIDTESQIKSLEAEQETLLKLIEKADDLDSIIKLQDRLSGIRSDLESYKSAKKLMENQIQYSSVSIDIDETEKIVKNDESFSAQVKEKFTKNLYSVGNFFREFAIGFIGGIPYLVVLAAIAAIVIVIAKKTKKKKETK